MGYYDIEDNVKEYIEMAEGFDGAMLIDELKNHSPKGSMVLEPGMGPGKDLDLLSEQYTVTGSDSSSVFINLYMKRNKQANLLLLDAVSIDTDRKFDCIYSNKVLHHFSRSEIIKSFSRQAEVLNNRGVVLHSFWYGDKETEEHHGILFHYYTEADLLVFASNRYEVVKLGRYKEMEDGDSIYLIARKIDR